MKRALVFSGGGSRGAYECGTWQALEEMNIRIDAVYGTSIGAINAALVAQGDLNTALELWENIRMDQIVSLEEGEELSVERMVHRKRDLIPFLMENAKNFLMDITPMENLMNKTIDEGRVRAGGLELGMMITRVPSLAGCEMRLKDIPLGELNDYILASASCFPIFPLRQIGSELFMDGGYADNMPIGMALQDGADEIIAVDIHPQPVHPEYASMPFLTQIHPLHELGSFLDFSPAQLRRSRMMGYYDTLKAHARLDGIRYTFTRVGDLKTAGAARRYVQRIARFDAQCSDRGGDAVLIGALAAETPLRRLSWKDCLLRGLELCAQVMGFREDAIYDLDVLTQRLQKYVRSQDDGEAPSDRGMAEAARLGDRALVAYLANAMARDADFENRCARRMADYPLETAAAMYLDCMGGSC